jgi:hypothetical protein
MLQSNAMPFEWLVVCLLYDYDKEVYYLLKQHVRVT